METKEHMDGRRWFGFNGHCNKSFFIQIKIIVMKFLQKLFHWDADQGPFEKGLTVLLAIFGIFCIVWLIVASYGVGNTYLAEAHKLGKGGSETLWATVLFVIAGVWAWAVFSDRVPFKINDIVAVISILILLILAVNANTGFFHYIH